MEPTLDSTVDTAPTTALLAPMEARALGALMEKQLTTPDAYPLTLNSLLLACNQKTSREPVTNYESGALQRCLSALQDRSLVELDYGSRAARYGQRLTRVLSVDKATQAILTVMLLRGPQTVAEILNRTQRMFEFASGTALEEKLAQLCAKTTPHIMHIPKQAGQREDRYMHLLCGEPDLAAIAAIQSQAKAASSSSDENVQQLEQSLAQQTQQINLLENKVALLEKQIALLMDLNGITNDDLTN